MSVYECGINHFTKALTFPFTMGYNIAMETLRIYEIDYSVSPGGINSFEIYNDLDNDYETPFPLYESESLVDACNWAYKQGCNFTVFTLAQNELEYSNA